MCKNFPNYLPALTIVIVVIYSFYAYVVVYCLYYLTNPVKKSAYITAYHVLMMLFMWSFLATMCTRHNPILDEYRLSGQDHRRLIALPQSEVDNVLKKIISVRRLEIYTCTDTGQIRYCRNCHVIKPDRTHHCSTCERCVLKMDHHCPWVANCVGFNNYKQFILTLLYALFWSSFYAGTIAEHIVDIWKDFYNNWNKIVIGVGFVIAGFSALLVFTLFVYHVVLVFKNETTLEASRDVTFREDNLTFDVGKWNNFTQVFGNNVCLWLLPVSTSLGNGHEFPLARE